jgi:hypothetical protein
MRQCEALRLIGLGCYTYALRHGPDVLASATSLTVGERDDLAAAGVLHHTGSAPVGGEPHARDELRRFDG